MSDTIDIEKLRSNINKNLGILRSEHRDMPWRWTHIDRVRSQYNIFNRYS